MDYEKKIKNLEAKIEQLKQELVTDELTKILNRKGLMDMLGVMHKEVGFSLENPQKRRNVLISAFSVVFIDIDHFKNVNTTYGHEGGDAALVQVATAIKHRVRGIDVVGRYGGEEIVVGLVGANLRDAQMIAEDIRKAVEDLIIELGNQTFSVTVSLGVAELKKGVTLEQLLASADEALYKAKNSGRNKVVVAEK